MAQVRLLLLWHQHQPFYQDLETGELVFPWVRLHGVKDYLGMAALLEECEPVHAVVNLVPSLLDQLEGYVAGRATDQALRLAAREPKELDEEERAFVLKHFFSANWDRMIRSVPRYSELLRKRRIGRVSAREAARAFSEADLRDLQVWANLAWVHPLTLAREAELQALVAKGRGFTEEEKQFLLHRQRELLAEVIPLHRKLEERGQVELTTTPYYHPILPLLCAMETAHQALPGCPLPKGREPLVADARAQLAGAVASHTRRFGRPPRGLWPSEGSVAEEILPLVAEAGFRWLATDEELLARSLPKAAGVSRGFARDKYGHVQRAETLYQPYRLPGAGGLTAVFRDHYLSDRVGFEYQAWVPEDAAADLIHRLEEAGQRAPGREVLVSLILDGENAWEYYPNQGVEFLRAFYRKLAESKTIETVRPAELFAAAPPKERLERLFAGSWINHDFYIWVGDPEDVRAWEALFRTRTDLVRAVGEPPADLLLSAPPEAAAPEGPAAPEQPAAPARDPAAAWRSLYAAEGSDWFWWYGKDRSSGNDEIFDELFRKHLANAYAFSGQPVPEFLRRPIGAAATVRPYAEPTRYLKVTVDGRATDFFEWLGAGRLCGPVSETGAFSRPAWRSSGVRPPAESGAPRTPDSGPPAASTAKPGSRAADGGGAMAASGTAAPLLEDVYFGFDRRRFCLRLDLADDWRERAPQAAVVRLWLLGDEERRWEFNLREGRAVPDDLDPPPLSAVDELLEAAFPLEALALKPGERFRFAVELLEGAAVRERLPAAGWIETSVPPEDYERSNWDAF